MWSGLPKLVFVTTLVINGVLWSQSRYAQVPDARAQIPSAASLLKRTFFEEQAGNTTLLWGGKVRAIIFEAMLLVPPLACTLSRRSLECCGSTFCLQNDGVSLFLAVAARISLV